MNNIIEQIKIAELDPNKTYFIQICLDNLDAEALQHVYSVLTEKFEKHGIKNIILFTPPETEVKFTEIGDKND